METNQNPNPFCAGDTPIIRIQVTVSDGTAFDPTGAEAIWTMAALTPPASGPWTALVSKSTLAGSASFTTDAAGNVYVDAPLAEADTSGLTPGKYYHECLVVESGGARSHIMTGQITILATPNP